MKKQIFGIALFVVIVGFSVFVYEYFSYSDTPDCAAVENSKCAPEPETYVYNGEYDAEDIAIHVSYIEANMKPQTVKTRLRLEWNGVGAPPKAVWVQVQFHNFDGSSAGWISAPTKFNAPFENGRQRVFEPVFDCNGCRGLSRNLYASARVWTPGSTGQKLLYDIRDMKSVVVRE